MINRNSIVFRSLTKELDLGHANWYKSRNYVPLNVVLDYVNVTRLVTYDFNWKNGIFHPTSTRNIRLDISGQFGIGIKRATPV